LDRVAQTVILPRAAETDSNSGEEMTIQTLLQRNGAFWRLLCLAAAPILAAYLLGSLATFANLTPWYHMLAKPDFNPPDWIFGPVWTMLYILMGIAAWRILRKPDSEARARALGFYFAQLALNILWSWMFFAMRSPMAGLINIIPQWFLLATTALCFWRIDRAAGAMLVPIILWVGFASILNFEIWRLNP